MIIALSMTYWQVQNDMEKVTASITTTTQMEWFRIFGGTDFESGYFVLQTSDGDFSLAGITNSYGAGFSDMWLMKTDANGQHEWNNTFGGTQWDEAFSLIQTSDGGFTLAGRTTSYGAGSWNLYLVKTDASGQMEWNRTFGGTGYSDAKSLIQTSDGGFLLAGSRDPYDGSSNNMWLVKTNVTGHMEWNRTFGGTSSDYAYSMIQTSDDCFVLAGVTSSYGAGRSDMWLVKTNATGHMEWDRTFGGTEFDYAYSLIQTADDGFALAGETNSYGAGSYDMWLVKTNVTGHMEWNTTFGGTDNDEANSVIQTSDGDFALGGTTESFGGGRSDMWLVKANTTGQLEWSDTFGGTDNDEANSVIQTSDGDFLLVGETDSYGDASGDIMLVKTKNINPHTSDSISKEYSSSRTSTVAKTSFSWTPLVVITSFVAIVLWKRRKYY